MSTTEEPDNFIKSFLITVLLSVLLSVLWDAGKPESEKYKNKENFFGNKI